MILPAVSHIGLCRAISTNIAHEPEARVSWYGSPPSNLVEVMEDQSNASEQPQESNAPGRNKLGPDEKTALLIEQTDKSLRQMEQNLGPDNPVIAQLLDTYAGILRQANVRHLDAINMEARAKAIRARHNIPQPTAAGAPRPSEELEFAAQPKSISARQVAAIFWVGAIVVSGALFYFSYLTLKPAVPTKKTKPAVAETAPPATTPGSAAVTEAPSSSPAVEDNSAEEQNAGDENEKIESVQQKILEAFNTGQSLEQANDIDGAMTSYQEAIVAGANGSNEVRKIIVSDALARSFESLAKIYRDKGEQEQASALDSQAQKVRNLLAQRGE